MLAASTGARVERFGHNISILALRSSHFTVRTLLKCLAVNQQVTEVPHNRRAVEREAKQRLVG